MKLYSPKAKKYLVRVDWIDGSYQLRMTPDSEKAHDFSVMSAQHIAAAFPLLEVER